MGRAKKKLAVREETRRAIIYLRVSTTEQADSGLGLEAQERRCRAHCEAQGWEVVAVFVDAGVSAKSLDRPELENALRALAAGCALVVLKLDRLTRSVVDLPALLERIDATGADWVSVSEHVDTSTATGRLMLRLILEISQWEREVIAERTVAALAEKKARGERLGTTPLGYRTDCDGNLTVDEAEQLTVSRARQLRDQGETLRAVAAVLTAEGHRTKRGGKWGAETVRLLLQPRYVETLAA